MFVGHAGSVSPAPASWAQPKCFVGQLTWPDKGAFKAPSYKMLGSGYRCWLHKVSTILYTSAPPVKQ